MNKKTDSEVHTETRRAKIKEESERLSAEADLADEERRAKDIQRDAKATKVDADALERQAGLVKDGETREQLLERVRQMREEKPDETPPPLGPSEFQQGQISIEQQAGKDAVARMEKDMERINEQRRKIEAETLEREGQMTTVHQPNPGMEEKFPVNKATFK